MHYATASSKIKRANSVLRLCPFAYYDTATLQLFQERKGKRKKRSVRNGFGNNIDIIIIIIIIIIIRFHSVHVGFNLTVKRQISEPFMLERKGRGTFQIRSKNGRRMGKRNKVGKNQYRGDPGED